MRRNLRLSIRYFWGRLQEKCLALRFYLEHYIRYGKKPRKMDAEEYGNFVIYVNGHRKLVKRKKKHK